ncbi:histidinol dehydrogenase [Parvularcula sp. ZS-1/3]|uniref:Histidinol dehydrogenase n=1 Tax=Parvularcula mediterranea TaxID=2732508 RepID=A0A7Y3RM58_9PROT|nr:histidinol dehydrogenase [Parvularcula mediterranea]NNU16638.1 histidinol dehydrogenase [Parvularcula mediterranea]
MRRLTTKDAGFEKELRALLQRDEEAVRGISDSVRTIVDDVRTRGDAALVELTQRFDQTDLSGGLAVTEAEIDAAIADCSKEALDALEVAAQRIEAYHEQQRPEDKQWADELGITLGWRWTALDAVGLYVPGGTAAYPSSVLMNAIPARVAGVERIVIVTPAKDGALNPLVLAAAKRAGVTEIYKIGGAQAVAALTFGTETIKPVDKIVGPGNAYVAEAKRQVFGHVGIDSIAGPSEITVIADEASDPVQIAADLLSQSEHDALSQSILLTPSASLATSVEGEVNRQLTDHPRRDIAKKAWDEQGVIIVTQDLADAAAASNIIAPEHLELVVDDPEALLPLIKHAGAVFLGRHTPEAIGDYVGGPSHVLPTSRSARFSSGLSILDFVKRMSVTGCPETGFREIGPAAATLADIEGLPSHAASVTLRLGPQKD